MMEPWKKVTAEKVTDIIDIEELTPGSSKMLEAGMRPEEFIAALSAEKKWMDAVKVLVHALPRRETVWWACVCAGEHVSAQKNEGDTAALKAAEKWAYKPTEEHRCAAFLQAQKSTEPSVGTLACMAVVFSQGKLELEDGQSVDFDADKFPQIASGVILTSANDMKGGEFEKNAERFLLKGKDIARGGSGKDKS